MELKSIEVSKLASTTNKELTALADEFGIKYNPESVNRAEVISALKEKVAQNVATTKNIKVVFHNAPNTPSEVFVQLNGKSFTFPKDMEVSVPAEILPLIDEAYEWRVEVDEYGHKTRRKYQAQTYTIVRD